MSSACASATWWSTPAPGRSGVQGNPIELTATEFNLLLYLMVHGRQVLSKAQILAAVWRRLHRRLQHRGDLHLLPAQEGRLLRRRRSSTPSVGWVTALREPAAVRLRRRLVATMIVLVALGLAAVDVITLTLAALLPLRTGRRSADHRQPAGEPASSTTPTSRGSVVTPAAMASRVSPDIYVELIDPDGTVVVSRPSGSSSGNGGQQVDPPPTLPRPLSQYTVRGGGPPEPIGPCLRALLHRGQRGLGRWSWSRVPTAGHIVARPDPGGGHPPRPRSTPPSISLRTIELAVSLGLLAALVILMTLLIRLGLRPLEDMTRRPTPSPPATSPAGAALRRQRLRSPGWAGPSTGC